MTAAAPIIVLSCDTSNLVAGYYSTVLVHTATMVKLSSVPVLNQGQTTWTYVANLVSNVTSPQVCDARCCAACSCAQALSNIF